MAFERLLRLTKKCPGYVVSGLRNAKCWYSNCHSRVVRKPILHHPGSFWHPVTFCHDTSTVTREQSGFMDSTILQGRGNLKILEQVTKEINSLSSKNIIPFNKCIVYYRRHFSQPGAQVVG